MAELPAKVTALQLLVAWETTVREESSARSGNVIGLSAFTLLGHLDSAGRALAVADLRTMMATLKLLAADSLATQDLGAAENRWVLLALTASAKDWTVRVDKARLTGTPMAKLVALVPLAVEQTRAHLHAQVASLVGLLGAAQLPALVVLAGLLAVAGHGTGEVSGLGYLN